MALETDTTQKRTISPLVLIYKAIKESRRVSGGKGCDIHVWEGGEWRQSSYFCRFKTSEQVLGGGCSNPALLSSQICKRKRPNTTTVIIVPMKEIKIQIGQIRGKKTRGRLQARDQMNGWNSSHQGQPWSPDERIQRDTIVSKPFLFRVPEPIEANEHETSGDGWGQEGFWLISQIHRTVCRDWDMNRYSVKREACLLR